MEENPDYVVKSDTKGNTQSNDDSNSDEDDYSDSEDDSEDDSENEYDEEEEEEEGNNSKSITNKALKATRQSSSKAVKLFLKHRTVITIACAIFAFRREIYGLILHISTSPTQDGKGRRMRFKLSPTAILKIILFIDFMRKMQDSGGGSNLDGGDGSHAINAPSGLIGHLLKDWIQPSNSAFIPPVEQHYTFEKMNERFIKDGNAWKKATGQSLAVPPPSSRVSFLKRPLSTTSTPSSSINEKNVTSAADITTVVIDMKIDTNVNSMSILRDQVTYLIHQHRINMEQQQDKQNLQNDDINQNNSTSFTNETFTTSSSNSSSLSLPSSTILEVVLILESPGGSATDYGLASYQIGRLRKETGIKLTICVDKVAASGGYMMAVMSSPGQLFAAPFAVLGSIGVYGQTLNIHNALQNYGVKPLVFRGGKDKAPVGLVGEITKDGIAKVQDMIDKTHAAFKNHVATARPILSDNIEKIATGDVWLGVDALEIGLVDRIITSDEYIWDKIQNGVRVLKLVKFHRPRFGFGGPRYGPAAAPGIFHSSIQAFTEFFCDIKGTVKKMNELLEIIPKQQSGADISKVVQAVSKVKSNTIHSL